MSIHKKLMQARLKLQTADLKKSGHNKFAGYKYFELGDFLPTIQEISNEVGICGTVTFYTDIAILKRDLNRFELGVHKMLPNVLLRQHEFDSIVSFCIYFLISKSSVPFWW